MGLAEWWGEGVCACCESRPPKSQHGYQAAARHSTVHSTVQRAVLTQVCLVGQYQAVAAAIILVLVCTAIIR